MLKLRSTRTFSRGKRRCLRAALTSFALTFCLAAFASAQDVSRLAVVGGTIHLGDGKLLAGDGIVLVENGKIVQVGKRDEVQIPPDAETIDATGLHVTPGWIDLRSQLFIDKADLLDRGSPDNRTVAAALTPFDSHWKATRDAGVTVVGISFPLSGTISGLGAILALGADEPEAGADEEFSFLVRRESHYVMALGVTGSRSTSAARLQQYYDARNKFLGARTYGKTWDKYWKDAESYNKALAKNKQSSAKSKQKKSSKSSSKPGESNSAKSKTPPGKKSAGSAEDEPKGKPKKPAPPAKKAPPTKKPSELKRPRKPRVELGKEALLRAMAGKLPIFIIAHRADDVEYARLLKEEFCFELTIIGGTASTRHAAALAKSKIAVALGPVLLQNRALEYRGHSEGVAHDLHSAGVPVSISSTLRGRLAPDRHSASRFLRLQACAAVRGGLDPETALTAVTLEPAKRLGISDRWGSIAVGKQADLVFFDGEPIDARSEVERVVVAGVTCMRKDTPRRAGWRRTKASADEIAMEAGSGARVIRGVNILRATSAGVELLEAASVGIRDGKIVAIAKATAEIPVGIEVIDAPGRWLLPGFVDAHSHVGIQGRVDEVAEVINEDLRVVDAYDPWSEELHRMIECGVTSLALSPGHANVVGGEISVVKVRPGRIPLLTPKRDGGGVLALKASLEPNFFLPRYPTALSGAASLFEGWMQVAKTKNLPVLVHVESSSQVERVCTQLEGSSCRAIVLEGNRPDSRSWRRVVPLLRNAAVVLRPRSFEDDDESLRAAAVLAGGGVDVAFSTSGSYQAPLTGAILAISRGMSLEAAFRGLTRVPAELYGLEERIGTIEEGADADLVLWSGDPFSLTAGIESVFVAGEAVLTRSPARSVPAPDVSSDDSSNDPSDADPDDASTQLNGISLTTSGRAAETLTSTATTLVIRARRVHTVSGPILENASVVIRGGKIVEVGQKVSVDVSDAGVKLIELNGDLVPGFVDGGSTLGLRGRPADEFRETTPALRVAAGIDLESPMMPRALAAGVTSGGVIPGARNVIGGLGAVIKTAGRSLRKDLLKTDSFLSVSLTGEAHSGNRDLRRGRPSSYYYRIPMTRMGTVFMTRRAFSEAAQLGIDGKTLLTPESGFSEMFSDEERAVLRRALERKLVVRFRADTRAEILTALRISKEFQLSPQVEGADEALNVIAELLEQKAAVILNSSYSPGIAARKNRHLSARLPAELAEAGIPFAFYSRESSSLPALRERVCLAVRYGLDPSAALRAITLAPAEILGVADRIGSIEVGKDADLVALTGNPMSIQSSVRWVMIEGEIRPPSGQPVDPGVARRVGPAAKRVAAFSSSASTENPSLDDPQS